MLIPTQIWEKFQLLTLRTITKGAKIINTIHSLHYIP